MGQKNCPKCKHFYITFHSSTPYGCRLFKFESHLYPEWIVEQSGEGACQGFSPREEAGRPTSRAADTYKSPHSYSEVPRENSPIGPDFVVSLSKERPKEK